MKVMQNCLWPQLQVMEFEKYQHTTTVPAASVLRVEARNTKAPLVANTSDENWEILLYYSCQDEVANAWRDKTGSGRATNEGE